ncbi:MAG: SAM-dependent methyltransferase, partial [Pseudomonadota bacterium]
AAEQPACIARMARHLAPHGVLMLTVGHAAGAADGTVGGERVFHDSLSPAAYAKALEDNGLRLTGFLAEDPETQSHTVLMARKP